MAYTDACVKRPTLSSAARLVRVRWSVLFETFSLFSLQLGQQILKVLIKHCFGNVWRQMVANSNDGPPAVGQTLERFIYVYLHFVPLAESEIATIRETSNKAVCLPEVIDHVAKIHARLKYETVSTGLGNIGCKLGEVSVGTEQDFLARVMNRGPELCIPSVTLQVMA
jgi:ribosomal protein S19